MARASLELGGCVAAWLQLLGLGLVLLRDVSGWLVTGWLAGLSCALEVTGLWWLGLAGCGSAYYLNLT